MSQFLKVKTAPEVLSILNGIEPLPTETVPLHRACGRVLAADIDAPEPVPHFARATMDGFAVRASDTFGASENLPALLEVSGEVLMGQSGSVPVGPGKTVAIATGGMLPEGGDAVVMEEYTQVLDANTVEVTRPVAPGENVLAVGDDIWEGEKVFLGGWRLRPQDVGVLAALGITEIAVHRHPRVALISTGDEVVPVDTRQVPADKIRDINTYTVAAQIASSGARIGTCEHVPDRLDDLVTACKRALADHDVLVLSGGSSLGVRDFTLRALEALPDPQLLVHGVAIRPGKPVILGTSGRKLFWGLPGQPVSALITCRVFVVPSLEKLEGRRETTVSNPCATCFRAILNRRLPSVHGRTDYFPVVVSGGTGRLPEAAPVFGKSGAISILARATGYVIVPEHAEGYDRGTEVEVHPFTD